MKLKLPVLLRGGIVIVTTVVVGVVVVTTVVVVVGMGVVVVVVVVVVVGAGVVVQAVKAGVVEYSLRVMLRAARISARVVDSGCSVVPLARSLGDFFDSATVAGKMLLRPPSVSVGAAIHWA